MAYRDRERLRSILCCPTCAGPLQWQAAEGRCAECALEVSIEEGAFVFHTDELPANYADPEYESANPYHLDCLELIKRHRNGLVVNYGAGSPKFPFDNLVEVEIRRYPSTDLVVVSDRLPLQDNSVDAVISLSVLEHVRDPFRYISEIRRVLKPGGGCVLHAAFLQPFHSYPNHYFNTTKAGLTYLMEGFEVTRLGVGDHQHPWITLNWVLNAYLQGLSPHDRDWMLSQPIGALMERMRDLAAKRQTLKQQPNADAIARSLNRFNRDHAGDLGALARLGERTRDTLAAGFALSAVKKGR